VWTEQEGCQFGHLLGFDEAFDGLSRQDHVLEYSLLGHVVGQRLCRDLALDLSAARGHGWRDVLWTPEQPNLIEAELSLLDGAEVSHSIVGSNAKITKSVLKNSLVGDDAVIVGVKGEVTVGDHSEVRAS